MKTFFLALFFLAAGLPALPQAGAVPSSDWSSYGNDPGGMRYSKLTEINAANVSQLKVAWEFHTGDISDGKDGRRRSGLETTPLMVDGTLYLTTAFNRVIALDPESGKQRWAYDPHIDQEWESGDGLINRGAAIWIDSKSEGQAPCHRRVFEATIDAQLVAVDAGSGAPCAGFGKDGKIGLRDVPGFRSGWYHITSPPAVIDDLVIVGSAIDDNGRADMPSGVVRAFDARSGQLRWSWDPIPPSRSADQKWLTGAANAWSVMVVDRERDLVFVPTGSASPDYYGGLRPGDNKWANSVVALHAKTGEVAWGFQLVHHDLWDYDSAAPPLLATLPHEGRNVPVVIQGNKTGFLYVLNRDTGKPVFPVEERPVPQSDVPGEVTSPTQPIPVAPPPLAPQHVSADDAWGLTPEDRDACRTWIHELRNEGIFTPPSLKGTLAIPGNVGGMTWSGYAFDPEQNLLFVNTNNFPTKVKLIPRAEFVQEMHKGEKGEYTAQTGAPYGMFRRPFLSPQAHLPCVLPPWGMLTAVDMAKGTIRWQVPLGSFGGPAPAGALSLGGPIVTAGGLVFVAGTYDPYIRAFDAKTGKKLWEAKLPASGHAMPMTYSVHGKQYLVIAAGGHAHIDEEPQGDAILAFALP
ncbi:pyrroloquinoline quinone-dependent dehydrogenase [Acidobacterium sp. S8]|uniref:pyrroloquinoline quinone-dependent dehydrogenase n=1 Tax=Acidobacterium sp. S8 TaxID=1641854 RepID=UPI00131C978C|nr:pyrroloquinoline quinone-dependent dehydrogenase [Acidobacterium sp. S8]